VPSSIDTARGKVCARCGRQLTQLESGEQRCRPCRNQDRKRERDAATNRAEAAAIQGGKVKVLRRRAEDGQDLTDDEWRMVVDDDPEPWDFGDDWRLWHASGALPPPSDDELREATAIFITGLAKQVLDRVGMSARQFAMNAGVTPRGVGYWLSGATTPKSTRNWPAAAWGILLLKETVDDQDLELTSHGLKPGKQSWDAFVPHRPHDLAPQNAAQVCDGCRTTRRQRLQRLEETRRR
jgi:hypothetical protein